MFENDSVITSTKSSKADDGAQKFQDYFDYTERLKRCPSHRFLAILRGERDNQLKLSIEPDSEKAVDIKFDVDMDKLEDSEADEIEEAFRLVEAGNLSVCL